MYPDTHTSTAVQVQGKYYLPYRAAVTGLVPVFHATPGAWSATPTSSTTPIPSAIIWIFEGRVRYYKQNSATFYSDLFPFAELAEFRGARPESRRAGQLHHRRQSHLRVLARRLEDVQARARSTFDVSRIRFNYLDFRNIKYYGVPQYPPGTEPLY